MASSAYLFRLDGGSAERPDFRLDATTREGAEVSVTWSQYPIEANATVADYGWTAPEKFSIEGVVTPLQFAVGATEDLDRVRSAMSRLRALANGREIVTLVTTFRSVDVAITKVHESRSVSGGRALQVKIDFQTVERARRRTVQVPPSRLRRPKRGSGKKLAQNVYRRRYDELSNKSWFNMTDSERRELGAVKGMYESYIKRRNESVITDESAGGTVLP